MYVIVPYFYHGGDFQCKHSYRTPPGTRVPRSLKDAVTYAAKPRGLNLSDFIIAAAANEAGRVIDENHVIHVTLRDYQALTEALNAPEKEPTEKALRAAEKYKNDVEHGRAVIQH